MKILCVENKRKILKNKKILENKLNVTLEFDNDNLKIIGEELDVYSAELAVSALDFGFDIKTVLLLKDESYIFEKLNLKNISRRHSLEEVRARVIGKEGKALMTIESLTGGYVVLHNNEVGVISKAEDMEKILHALTALIKGSKHSSIYAYLEKQNKEDIEDLGLKE